MLVRGDANARSVPGKLLRLTPGASIENDRHPVFQDAVLRLEAKPGSSVIDHLPAACIFGST
jgi:hypothetical protein